MSSADRQQVVSETLAALRDHYVFPERLDSGLAALRSRWSSRAFQRIDNAHALVDEMNSDFQEVFHDRHMNIHLAAAFPPEIFDDPDHPDPKLLAMDERDSAAHGFGVKAEVLADGIGYLELSEFPTISDGTRRAYAAAMEKLKGTRALIIDLRKNGGGDGDSVGELVGYLFDHRTLLQYDIERGGARHEHASPETVSGPRYGRTRPVYVLISSRTASAAEECAYDLQTQKRATVIGEHSMGAANHNRYLRVAGRFALSVPYMATENAVTGRNWEGVGVQPDVPATSGDALEIARKRALDATPAVAR